MKQGGATSVLRYFEFEFDIIWLADKLTQGNAYLLKDASLRSAAPLALVAEVSK